MKRFRQERAANRERGVVLTEFTILLPVLLVIMMGLVDLGRVIYAHQIMTDLTREAASLVSRGASPAQAYFATSLDEGPIRVDENGGVIISTVIRRDLDDPTPWIVEQVKNGPLGTVASRVGTPGGPASIPNVDGMQPGVTMMAVEIVHRFEPVFGLAEFGLDFYPDVLYDVAFF